MMWKEPNGASLSRRHVHALEPAGSVAAASLRRVGRVGRDPLEDRTTEMLASLLQRDERIAAAFWRLMVPTSAEDTAEATFTVSTQVHYRNAGRVDLEVLKSVSHTGSSAVLWVEVKAWAPETTDQLERYAAGVLQRAADTGSQSAPVALLAPATSPHWHNLEKHANHLVSWNQVAEMLRRVLSATCRGTEFPAGQSVADRVLHSYSGPAIGIEILSLLYHLERSSLVMTIDPIEPLDLQALARAREATRRVEAVYDAAVGQAFTRLEEVCGKLQVSTAPYTREETFNNVPVQWRWRSAVIVPGSRWTLEASLTDRVWWNQSIVGPAVAVGVTGVETDVNDLSDALVGALDQDHALERCGSGAWPRWYTPIALGDTLATATEDVSEQIHLLADSIHAELLRTLRVLGDAGLPLPVKASGGHEHAT